MNLRSNFTFQNRKTNPVILAFITAKARISLHKAIMTLVANQFSPYYCDTDSILFSGPKDAKIPLKFGMAFGDFKHELGEKSKILKFEAYGRKNFSIFFSNTDGKSNHLIKVCGMTLESQIVQKEIEDIFLFEKEKPKITQIRKIFSKNMSLRLPSIQRITLNNIDLRCERKNDGKCPNLTTKPWGYND